MASIICVSASVSLGKDMFATEDVLKNGRSEFNQVWWPLEAGRLWWRHLLRPAKFHGTQESGMVLCNGYKRVRNLTSWQFVTLATNFCLVFLHFSPKLHNHKSRRFANSLQKLAEKSNNWISDLRVANKTKDQGDNPLQFFPPSYDAPYQMSRRKKERNNKSDRYLWNLTIEPKLLMAFQFVW